MELNAGITRIVITDKTSGRGGWRFERSESLHPKANDIYRRLFEIKNMPLMPGVEQVFCTKEEFMAGFDYQLGIDVILKFESGFQKTLQEKLLNTTFYTVTVEYFQDWKTEEQGDWFNLKCQYYFVGYAPNGSEGITRWQLLNWPQLQEATEQGRVRWWDNINKTDGARASFRYAYFDSIPEDCIVADESIFENKQLNLF